MKIKNILIMVLAMIAATSCTNEDEGGGFVQVPLTISAVINNATATRAVAEVSAFTSGAQIGVFGNYSDVTGYTTERPTNKLYEYDGTGWSSSDPFYYQNKGNVIFTAYYPYSADNYGDGSTEVEAQDFLYAKGVEGSVSSNNVTFVFDHIMSKVNITVKKGKGVTDDEIKSIGRFYIKGLYTKGTFNTSEGTVVGTSDTDYIEGTVSTDGTGSAIVFPQEGTLTFIAKIKGINYQSQVITATLEGGKVYGYTITVNKTGLSVVQNSDISSWGVINATFDEDGNLISSSEPSPLDPNNNGIDGWDEENKTFDEDGYEVTTAKLYSLVLSDGSFVDTTDDLTDDQKSKVLGIVYYVNESHGLIISTTHLNGGNSMKWADMDSYITSMSAISGAGSWRIPTLSELEQIRSDVTNINSILKALGKTELKTGGSDYYWSSEEKDSSNAYVIRFGKTDSNETKGKTGSQYAIPICAF